MTADRPTKSEILEKYRNVIEADDFEILYQDSIPSPEESHRENAWLQYLGPLNGWFVWGKRFVTGAIVLICSSGSFESGLQTVDKWSRRGFDQIAQYVQLGLDNRDTPADQYVLFEKQDNRALPPEAPITLATTTTTPNPNPSGQFEIHPGSGIAPSSDYWT